MHQSNPQPAIDSREAYEAPVLVEFGSIVELTQAGGVSQVEGQTPIPNKKP
ncbi:lasso RiPP family leader peptide-containing protein [Thermomonas sp.]|uniref:lasso RiPP family leader peptide-containing protein n=1 Tax=Thermomonas sp. TaxID=1971895 RepID=UPI0035AE924E